VKIPDLPAIIRIGRWALELEVEAEIF